MARPRTSKFWIDQIAALHEATGMRAPAIARELEKRFAKGSLQIPSGVGGIPDPRTIRKILNEHIVRPESERVIYRPFLWPESMQRGDLPWEQSRAGLDLLRLHRERGLPVPSVLEVGWFWRVTQAAPDMPALERLKLSVYLISASATPQYDQRPFLRSIEELLTYQRPGKPASTQWGAAAGYLLYMLSNLGTKKRTTKKKGKKRWA